MNPLAIIRSGTAGASLTPGQRAFIKLVKGLVITGVSAVLVYGGPVANLLQGNQFQTAAKLSAVVFLAAVGHAVDKYYSAQGDAPLGAVAGQVASQLDSAAASLGQNTVKQPS